MLKGLSTGATNPTLVALSQKIHALGELKRDYIVDTAATKMVVQEDNKLALRFLDPGINADIETPILPLAHDQIGQRLAIPAKYYDRCAAKAPILLATQVNHWMANEPEKRMVRTIGGDTRAFLSDRYQRIENEHIANVALPVLLDIPDVQIVSCEVTEHRLYIQAVSPRVQGEVKKGDVVQAGVVISNSEVGLGAVNVSELDWRLWCLNGAVSQNVLKAYHVGRRIEDSEALWADDTRKADDRAVLLKVRDMVAAAVDGVRFKARLEKMQNLAVARITGDPAKAVEVLSQTIGASDAEQGGILRALIEGADLSAWGLVNAITAQAHTATSYDRAFDFEVAGGKMINAAKGDWTRILEAA